MIGVKNFINKLSNTQKITYSILSVILILFISIGVPTLARYRNRNTIINALIWDGSIADSYHKGTGTENDPYIISNGAELAYFSMQLLENTYENTYFALDNDIILNEGIFIYDEQDGLKYIVDEQEYYLTDYDNKYYDNIERIGTETGTVNLFSPFRNFKGCFDGHSYSIYGLYITDENSAELGLFTALEGNVKDLYIENALIYGGRITGGIASTSSDSSINNVLFNGYVIGKRSNIIKEITIYPTAPLINVAKEGNTSYIDLSNDYSLTGSNIISTSIKGNYTINGADELETIIEINDQVVSGGNFEIALGDHLIDNITVWTSTTSEEEVSVTFSDLQYQIIYSYGISGGIVGKGNNTTIVNTINNADIYGYSVSGGIVGVTTDLININQSYNNGDIISNYVSGGLIGVIEKSDNEITVSKSYNSGNINALNNGGLVGIISNNLGTVLFDKVFDTSTTYSINTINNTMVNVEDAYYIAEEAIRDGIANGAFVTVSLSNLYSKEYVMDHLLFNEFIDFNDLEVNTDNVWVYEDESLPILFVDDLNNPIANIHAGVYTWNNLSMDLDPLRFASNLTFSIKEANELNPLDEIYYYISNSLEPLSKTELLELDSWIPYDNIVQINNDGIYVIYAKVVDYYENETYLNTDLLILDTQGPSVNITMDNQNWTSLRSDLGYVYIDRAKSIIIDATNDISGIKHIQYYITNEILSKNELEALSDNNWINYTNSIMILEKGTYVVYAKVIDNFDYATYFNTDYIVLDGYQLNFLKVGRNTSNYVDEEPNISNKSTITLNFSYSKMLESLTEHTHNLISNILLPLGTKITLLDHIRNKIYNYQITTEEDIYHYFDSCGSEELDCIKKATYPFTLFKEVGTIDKFYVDDSYYSEGNINENFTIILDFSKTNIDVNYNDTLIYLELHNAEGINVRPTLYDDLKKINIYSSVNGESAQGTLSLTTDYVGSEIVYDSASTTDIDITSEINYKQINDLKIIDTSYEDKEIGLALKLVDNEGQIIEHQYFKNIIFKIGEERYYPGQDNIIRINLKSGITDVTKTLTIVTKEDNVTLKEGNYYLEISNYASYDGYYYDELSDSEISIPIVVGKNNFNIPHSFDVIMDDTNRIIGKDDENAQVLFKILQNGSFDEPNIRVSLYKKDQITAYNQDYSLIDLKDYVSDVLDECSDKIYYVSTNPSFYDGTENTYNNFELNLITTNFENTGYKFVFTLYDGTTKIGTIEKYFIVK